MWRGPWRGLAPTFLCGAVLAAPAADETGVRRLELVVREAAGLRRFGYPVTVVLPPEPAARASDRFRLLENGQPVAAQFRLVAGGRGRAAVYLDFKASHRPLAKHTHRVEYRPGVEPARAERRLHGRWGRGRPDGGPRPGAGVRAAARPVRPATPGADRLAGPATPR
jgi:hypothetical protein